MSLYNYSLKKSCTIQSLPKIGLLHALGLREGLKINIMSKQPFGGPIIIQIGKRSFAIAKDVAEQISVGEAY